MLHLFYKTRNIAGLLLVTGPVLSIPAAEPSLSFYLPFLAGAAASVPLLTSALRRLPFRTWLIFCGLCAVLSIYLLPQESDTYFLLSAAAAGTAFSGLVLILPPNVSVGWFRRSKTYVLSLVWALSLLAALLWSLSFSLWPDGTSLLAALSLAAGLLVFLERPPVDYRRRDNPLIAGRTSAFVKPSIYAASIAAAPGLAYSLAVLGSGKASADTAAAFLGGNMAAISGLSGSSWLYGPLPLLLLPAAPLLTGYLIEKKGVFSGCVYLIFLCEGAMLCLGSLGGAFFTGIGVCLIFLAAGGLPVMLPVLTFYLYGHVNFLESFSRLAVFLPLGLLTSLPFCHLARTGNLSAEEPVVFLLFLLVLSFFCIFFAWKRRFVILKNKIV